MEQSSIQQQQGDGDLEGYLKRIDSAYLYEKVREEPAASSAGGVSSKKRRKILYYKKIAEQQRAKRGKGKLSSHKRKQTNCRSNRKRNGTRR